MSRMIASSSSRLPSHTSLVWRLSSLKGMYDMWAAALGCGVGDFTRARKKPTEYFFLFSRAPCFYFHAHVLRSGGCADSPGPNPRNAMRYKTARSVDAYEKIEQVGEGTYGEVFMARSRDDSSLVALKKVKLEGEKEGFPITAIREIKILNSLNHTNVIQLKEIVTSRVRAAFLHPTSFPLNLSLTGLQNMGSIYMVFEYMDHDLTGLADRPGMKFSVPQIK